MVRKFITPKGFTGRIASKPKAKMNHTKTIMGGLRKLFPSRTCSEPVKPQEPVHRLKSSEEINESLRMASDGLAKLFKR